MNKVRSNWVYDTETLSSCIMWCFVNYATEERYHFILWRKQNDLDKLFKWLHKSIDLQERYIGFNSLHFDSQILEWMLDNQEALEYMPNEMAINAIYGKSQEIIGRADRGEWQEYPEWKMQILQLDLFKMNHWDNPAKSCSLKWLECSIDWPNVEDSPYTHTHYIENERELAELKSYCYNDCDATKKILYISKDNVDLRRDLTREYGVNLYSASEPRMSKDLFLHFLCQKTGIPRKEMKQFSTVRDKIKVKEILLPYIEFQRQEFTMLLNNFRKLEIPGHTLKEAFTYTVNYKGMAIDYGVGGIHAFSTPGKYVSDEKVVLKTSDVISYYPNLAIRNKWSPAHISKKAFCEQYEWFFEERKKHPKGSAKNYALKILLNSTFGLSIDKHSFLSDPQLGCQITINGQLLLTMLIEMVCEGIPEAKPIMMNTDGIEVLIPREKEQLYMDICKKWESMTQLGLEHDNYKELFAFDCNNYIAVFENGKKKCKGRFEFEAHDKYDINVLHKNKSFLVVCKALYEYFVNGVDPETFIKAHRNIYDFCGYARAKGQWKFYHITSDSNGVYRVPIQKTLRYYISKTGSKVVKFKPMDPGKEKSKKNVDRTIQVQAGRNHLQVFNKYEERLWEDYTIDYNFYVKETYKEINTLEAKQLDLFGNEITVSM